MFVTLVSAVSFYLTGAVFRGYLLDNDAVGYTSDAVALQVLVAEWGHWGASAVWLGWDNFALKLPVYWLTHALFGTGRWVVLLEIIVLEFASLLIIAHALRMLRKSRQTIAERASGSLNLYVIAFSAWIMLVPIGLVFHESPGNRNIELALAFWAVTSIVTVVDRGENRILHLAAAVLVLGVVDATDPYFVGMVSLSLTLWAAYLWIFGHGWRRPVTVLATVIASLAVYELGVRVLDALHIHSAISRDLTFITWDGMPAGVSRTLGAVLASFGGDIAGAGLPPYRPVLIAALNAAVLLTFVVLAMSTQRKRPAPVPTYWAILLVVVPSIYLLTSGSEPRYMIFMVVACVALLFSVELRFTGALRRLFVLALALTIAASGYQTLRLGKEAVHSWANRNYAQAYGDVATVVRDNGLTKGYAQYWMASITTYLTDDYSLTIPMGCNNGTSAVFFWGTDAGWLVKPATRTFVIVDKRAQNIFGICSDDDLTRQFGKPDSVLPVNDSASVWVWNYDVTSRIPNADEPPQP